MLPKRSDVIILDVDAKATPVRSGTYGGWFTMDVPITLPKGTLLRFYRTHQGNVIGYVVTDPRARKFVKTINPDFNARQSYKVDAHCASFFCRSEDFKPEMLDNTLDKEVEKWSQGKGA